MAVTLVPLVVVGAAGGVVVAGAGGAAAVGGGILGGLVGGGAWALGKGMLDDPPEASDHLVLTSQPQVVRPRVDTEKIGTAIRDVLQGLAGGRPTISHGPCNRGGTQARAKKKPWRRSFAVTTPVAADLRLRSILQVGRIKIVAGPDLAVGQQRIAVFDSQTGQIYVGNKSGIHVLVVQGSGNDPTQMGRYLSGHMRIDPDGVPVFISQGLGGTYTTRDLHQRINPLTNVPKNWEDQVRGTGVRLEQE